jgi:hypothetical protein
MLEKGWQIGLHQSFYSWNNPKIMDKEKKKIENILGISITSCRQHWLRFGWRDTWKSQEKTGLLIDSTLGFNDRPGFRNSSAIIFHPWDFEKNSPLKIQVIPLVLMDSHLYDYAQLTEEGIQREIKRWLEEIKFVKGIATVLWHPHTLSKDYGWQNGFEFLLKELKNLENDNFTNEED